MPTERSSNASTALAVVATIRKHPLQLKKEIRRGKSQKIEGFFLVGGERGLARAGVGAELAAQQFCAKWVLASAYSRAKKVQF